MLANFNKLNAIGFGFRITLHFPAENQVCFAYIDSAMFYHINNPLSTRYPEYLLNVSLGNDVLLSRLLNFAPFALLFAPLASRFFLDTIV